MTATDDSTRPTAPAPAGGRHVVLLLVVLGAALTLLALTGRHQSNRPVGFEADRYSVTDADATGAGGGEGPALAGQAAYWNDRVTYPTGRFNPAWLRRAAAQDAHVNNGVPAVPPASAAGRGGGTGSGSGSLNAALTGSDTTATSATAASSTLTTSQLTASGFTSLGPQPLHMTGCSGCYNYATTAGRVNAIVADPTTTTPGAITAYAATVGGGVWKTTNCCSASTTWSVTTDDVGIPDISVDALTLDPQNPQTIYAGTGDLNFGSYSMGSQGILKSTDGGATWTVKGANVFGSAYSEPTDGANGPSGHFPQYESVGKVAVDPNNSANVAAGAKTGLYLSHDGGDTWTRCTTNNFTSQRQDITGLVLTDMGSTTRILATVGARGFSSAVQDDVGKNGANGVYRATMPASGCPGSFASLASDASGFVFGTAVTGSPYATGASMHAGSGTAYSSTSAGNQLGRLEIAVAPSDPSVVYVQVQSIAPNSDSGCGSNPGCQLGVWSSTDGGTTWSFMAGSAGGSLRDCGNASADYDQNWYDQSLAVDPTNPDRVFVSTFDAWFATRTGTTFNDLTCAYSYPHLNSPSGVGPVHADQHALAFVPGTSALLLGDDGGVHGTADASVTTSTTDPTWFNMDGGFDTIEFYSGDISGGFATATAPSVNGGAQDNGSSSVTFSGSPTGPVQWQMGKGGDGFYARIDPIGSNGAGAFYQGGNAGHIYRCTSSCTAAGAAWSDISNATMLGDQQAFMLPYEIFKGTPGNAATDCSATTCNHLIAGTVRVWENDNAKAGSGTSWYPNSPANLTKQALGNRSFINQLAFSPATSSLAIVGTNDGNVQVGRGLGGGTGSPATWTNVTGSNATLPNRPILDVAMDPGSLNTSGAPIVGYAAVGGFDANTPSTPGHVFRVTCAVNCASYTWADKTGNLPDIPVDSIIANPNYPQQVFAGTDFGLYYTDDITQATPTWYRFETGLPHAMVWDLQIDRGATTLSVWTRGRGAYVWPLPNGGINRTAQTITITKHAPASSIYGARFTVAATASSGLPVSYGTSGGCTNSGTTVTITDATHNCTVTYDQAGDSTFAPAPQQTDHVTVSAAGTTTTVALVARAPNPAPQVGDTADLTATVTPDPTTAGDGVFSGTVSFTFNGSPVGTAQPVDDANPTASVAASLAGLDAGSVPIAATYTPQSPGNYAGSTTSGATGTIVREGAKASGNPDGAVRLDYTGSRLGPTGKGHKLTATLRQSLAPETGDADFVDFTGANVQVVFDVVAAGCPSTCPAAPVWSSSPVTVTDAGDWATSGNGVATVSAPSTLAKGSYLVEAHVADNPKVRAEVATAALVVRGTSGHYFAAGGFLVPDSTSNAGTEQGAFGVLARKTSSGITGSGVYVYRLRLDVNTSTATVPATCSTLGGSCHDVDVIVRSTGLSALHFGTTAYPYKGYVTGNALVQVIDAADGTTDYPALDLTGGLFRVDGTDTASGGGSDLLGFTAYRTATAVYHQAYVPTSGALPQSGVSSPTNQSTLGGGNVTIHP